MVDQKIITEEQNYKGLNDWIEQIGAKKFLLVCDRSICYLKSFIAKLEDLNKIGVKIIRFSNFSPNPLYESVIEGVKLFRKEACDAIITVGGGSAIDVAKCIKLYSNMSGDGADGDFLKQDIIPNNIPFLAMPTTAGTGSEATRYAVIYYDDKKQSITSESCIPSTVLFDPNVLNTLPLYHKKATMMDALCHAIESFWSVNSTNESKKYSKEAIESIIKNMDGYLENTKEGNAGMLMAAHLAGKAINIAQTTAGHAMSYKITSLFGFAHGHAAALCLPYLWEYMYKNSQACIDSRGRTYVMSVFDEISHALGVNSIVDAICMFKHLLLNLKMSYPISDNRESDLKLLVNSVNEVRLKNNPILLTPESIYNLYSLIVK